MKNNIIGKAVVAAAKKDYAGFRDEVEKVLSAKMQAKVEDMVAVKQTTLFKQGV